MNHICLALLAFLLSLAACHDGRIKYIGNRLIEEFERMEIPLDEYFQGELATFQMQVFSQGSLPPPPEISNMITLSKPFQHFSWDFIDAKSFKKIKVQPFKRSTLIRDEILYSFRNGTTKSMEFVTRDLKFHQYNLSSYIDQGDIRKVRELQLNISSLGEADCHDLTYNFNNNYEYFLFFCQRFEVASFYEQVIYSVVHINKTQLQIDASSPNVIKEYEFKANDLEYVLDFDQGIRMIKTHIKRDVDPDIQNKVFFQVYKRIMVHQTLPGKQLIIISLNMSVFDEMEADCISYKRGSPIISSVQELILGRDKSLYLQISDSLILRDDIFTRNDLTYWAFTMSDDTIDICAFNRYDIGNIKVPVISCSGIDTQRVAMQGLKIAALYKDVEPTNGLALGSDMNFYGICSQPPAVVEYDMRDPDNVIINKIFTVNRREENWVGTMRMAVNQNYVLHLLSDPVTGLQVIRVFDRYQSLHNSAKFDIPVFSSTIADYFQFPNHFFNILILRDERTVNVTALLNYAIVLDGRGPLRSDIKDQEFEVTLYATFREDILVDVFSVTFIDKFNTSIVPMGKLDADVFYNCGEPSLNYQVSLLLNGPNYNLSQADSVNHTGFFEFENQDLKLFQSASFDFSACQTNFLFPYLRTYDQIYRQNSDQDYEMPTILVCVNGNSLSSYLMRMGNQTLMIKTNQIELPEVNVIDVVGDQQERAILVLAENPAYAQHQQLGNVGLTGERYELHFFAVQNQLLWHTKKNFGSYTNITVFNYDSILNNCVIVDFKQFIAEDVVDENKDEQMLYYEKMRIIHVNMTSFKITLGSVSDLIQVNPRTRTAKVVSVGEHVVFALTLDRRIIQYQIGKQRIMPIRVIELENLVNFDVFDGKFFIVYREKNIIDVYTVELHLYLKYRMRLPLYQEYQSFQFRLTLERNMALPVPIRAYDSDFFSFLMVDQKNITRTFLFVHYLEINQHNSFVLVRDFTQLLGYKDSSDDSIITYGNIILAGDRSGKTTLGAMSIDRIHLFDAQYFNKLSLNSMGFQELMRVCRNIKVNYDFTGKEIDSNTVIDTISVWPYSLFSDTDRKDQGNAQTQMINLKVRTLNQGLSPSTKAAKSKGPLNIYVANETTSTSQQLQLIHENYIEGQALKFVTKCKYIDWDGNEIDCSEGVEEQSRDVPYKFPIEFVTSTRRVERSFTMGKLYFMFDNLNQLVVSRLPLYQKDLNGVDGFPLIKLFQGSQVDLFDCEIHGFADYYHLANYTQHAKNQVNGSEAYLLFYQCKAKASTMRKVLKYALITVFPFKTQFNDNNEDTFSTPFKVQTFLSSIDLPYDIIELEVFNLEYEIDSFKRFQLSFYIAYSCNIENSYSNVLYIDELYINPEISLAGLKRHIGMLSASVVGNDTYKVTKLVKIGGSNLIIAVLENFGAQILNLTRLNPEQEAPRLSEIILAELDIMQEVEKYNMQYQLLQEKGKLEVWAATFNNPYSVHLISNYGLFIFDFYVNLECERDININGGYLGLINQQVRHYRMIFDEFNGQVAQNQYGSAFLVSKNLGSGQYEVYLLAVSYSTSANSRVLKYISVTWNEKCYSLNHDLYYVNSPEDQIAVSFICNQYLKIHRACMRPHVALNINHFIGNATHYDQGQHDFEPGVYKYNMFNIKMYGVNSMLSSVEEAMFDETNTESVEIRIHYKERCFYERSYALLALGIIIVIAVLFFVYIFMDQKQDQEDQDLSKNKYERFRNISFLTDSSIDKQHLRLTLKSQKSGTDSSIQQQTSASSQQLTTFPKSGSVDEHFFFSFRNKRAQEVAQNEQQELRMTEKNRLLDEQSKQIEQEILTLRKSSAARTNTGLQNESVMSSHSRRQSEVSGNFGPFQQQTKNSNRGSGEANEQQRETSEFQSLRSSQIEDTEKLQRDSQV